MALTAEGALACASGSHVWKGKIPDFAARPIKTSAKDAIIMPGGNVVACCMSTVQFRVPVPRLTRDISKRNMNPAKVKSMETEATKIYLIAASIFSRADRMAMSIAEMIVVSSAKIQKSARLSEMNARTMTSRSRVQAI